MHIRSVFRLSTLVLVVGGCAAEEPTVDGPSSTLTQDLTRGDSSDATYSPDLPMRATGRLVFKGQASCTASAIARNVVLFASHCLCPAFKAAGTGPGATLAAADWTFVLPYQNAAGQSVEPGPNPDQGYALSSGGIVGVGSVGYFMHPKKCDADRPPEANRADLAVVVLSRALTPTELPQVMPIYTGGDFVDRIFNEPGFFSPPVQMVGWAGSTSVKKVGTPQSGQTLSFEQGFIWLTHSKSSHTKIEHGDSGGPLTFTKDGTTPTQFGVSASMFTRQGIDSWFNDDADIWTPTYNSYWANGTFIEKYLVDADNDDVLDTADNCAPSLCPYDSSRCANPTQLDGDGDGVGDACDNCAPTRCSDEGRPLAFCANPTQADLDHDGHGDVCDLCPASSGSSLWSDDDGDRLGTCDNCSEIPNGLRACQADGDCSGASATGAICTGVGDSLGYGRCSNDGSACIANASCGAGTCAGVGTYGRCSVQLDDSDGDGVGDACDSCVQVKNRETQIDSNVLSQSAIGAGALGDVCDPVPVFDVRQKVALPTSSSDVAYRKVVELRTWASLGRSSGTGSSSYAGDVSVRYCSCIDDDSQVLDEAACLLSLCVTDPARRDLSRWVSLQLSPIGGAPTPTLHPTFSNSVSCGGTEVLAASGADTTAAGECHVGAAFDFQWAYAKDVDAGRIPSAGLDSGAPITAGIVWTEVGFGATDFRSVYASSRDASTAGNLRNHFSYLSTPLLSRVLIDANELQVPIDEFKLRFGGTLIRPDLFGGRPPIGDPWGPVSGPTWLVGDHNSVFAVGGVLQDVTTSMSESMLLPFASTGVRFVMSAQAPAFARRADGLAFAMVPTQWRKSYGAPLLARFDGGDAFDFAHEDGGLLWQSYEYEANSDVLLESQPGTATLDSRPALHWQKPVRSAFVPSDRDGASFVFAPSHNQLFLIGGQREGKPTDEIWAYDFGDETWARQFTRAHTDVMAPWIGVGEVLAAAMDEQSGLLVVVDAVSDTASRSPASSAQPQRSRIVVWDLVSQQATVVMDGPRARVHSDLSLVPRGHGRFALVAQAGASDVFQVHELSISPLGVQAEAFANGRGRVVPGAHEGPAGVVVPVLDANGKAAFVDVTRWVPARPLPL